jgi:hypothetical protein
MCVPDVSKEDVVTSSKTLLEECDGRGRGDLADQLNRRVEAGDRVEDQVVAVPSSAGVAVVVEEPSVEGLGVGGLPVAIEGDPNTKTIQS